MATAKEKFEVLARKAGVPEERIAAILEFAQAPAIAEELNQLVFGGENYAAQVGRVNALQEQSKAWEKWREDAEQVNANLNAQLAATRAQIAPLAQQFGYQEPQMAQAAPVYPNYQAAGYPQYPAQFTAGYPVQPPQFQAQYPNPNPNPYQLPTQSRPLTMADLTAQLSDRDARYAATIKESVQLASNHAAKYKEGLDTDALDKLAIEMGTRMGRPVTLTEAYNAMVAPREAERSAAAEKERVDRLVEERFQQRMAGVDLPVAAQPSAVSQFDPNRHAPDDLDSQLIAVLAGRSTE